MIPQEAPKQLFPTMHSTSMWPELRWAPHPAPTTAPPGTDTPPTDWESKGTNFLQPSYHSPVLNH